MKDYLLQSTSYSKSNSKTKAPRQRHVGVTMQSIIQRQISDMLIYKNMLFMLYTVADKFYNVWVP